MQSYLAPIQLDTQWREVKLLRIGRFALYYLELDTEAGGIWDLGMKNWQSLDPTEVRAVKRAMEIIEGKRSLDLLDLPLSNQNVNQ